ncbi:branched-chain amino acid ABC transporter substrate-binding protein [Chryseobacterium gambrini]|uniref:Branched-chain amino acid ABC transporter substrate-binding protein n=1 Tax=Chryseobacterium gambrini TaxID=373672 RepID=A0AAJ1VJL8_9FLAO|nr:MULTISPECIES: branched-chain amino acid ABC transporter substrate-binding protein [Chryseobacterium]MDN4012588.1 branched-chain amino acid ABC transporter substrate-binding protein [Chryseobacterium gambrini]MDN4031775.1 branched-chain amino acid ABC transporter substrate-binding protein [Chryseobacterium gambrini]QWA38483.1 branched-chain amino acid ABC transporter substrate-binding protein [Chryseobacterium sp. ZHDP1]
MNWNFLDILDIVFDALELFGRNSSSDLSYHEKLKNEKPKKYFTEKVSAVFLFSSGVLFFFVFKDPLPSEKYVQTLIVASLIGVAISFLLFFVLHSLEKYYFKSVFQWLFFSVSVLSFIISLVLWVYFKSGLFV